MNRFLLLVVLSLLSIAAVGAAETCTEEYCVCSGECPSSYESKFESISSISNGEGYVCYATNGVTFGIGGAEVTFGEESVLVSDLSACPDAISTPTISAVIADDSSACLPSFVPSIIIALFVGVWNMV